MYIEGSAEFKHHAATYGPQSKFGYKDFIPLLTAEKFDAARWAALFKSAGARFVVPVAEHHDGFPMYDSSLTEWCAAKMGPKRDIVGELAAAVRREGLVFGLSSHRAEDWWIEQPAFQPYLQTFGAFYYNRGREWGRGVAINYKNKAFAEKAAVLDIERGQLAGVRPLYWQNDTSVSKNSWGYISSQDYKTAESIIGDLTDVVSKNGALLLNIGPRPDGTIPEPEEKMLLEIGRWLAVNGEAIYRTRPWVVFGEGPTQVVEGSFADTKRAAFTGQDIRFTTRGGALYAIVLAWPGQEATVKSLAKSAGLAEGEVSGVQLLGHKGTLQWSRTDAGLVVKMPAEKPCQYAYTLKITGLKIKAPAAGGTAR
jgi:alpha-L-fucosidase